MSSENPFKREKLPLEIREATEVDIPKIAHIARMARESNLPYLPTLHTLDEDINYFANKVFKEDQIAVADENGTVIGFCAFREDWLDHLYILPEHQGKGLGKALLNKAKDTYPYLQLWVFQKNADAIQFYEMNGFKLVTETDGQNNEEREPDALYAWSKETTK